MSVQLYHDLKARQERELNAFPIAYAFSEEQLDDALIKLGAPIDQCCTVMGIGDVVRKDDAHDLIMMLKRHRDELHELLNSDANLAKDIFLYEMDNHEYAINWSGDDDVLGSLCLTWSKVKEMGLELSYYMARKEHMKNAEEWM